MAGEDITPNVVLTADTAQYDRAMTQSAQVTENLGTSIDVISGKLDKLAKSAGRKLIGIGAADVAAITGATAAFAAYEKQMSQLQAQAAILNRTVEGQNRAFGTYERSVSNLRQTFGTTTAEAAALTQQLSKVADRTQSIDRLSTTFVKMSNATGESTVQLATSVTNLQRVMGTPQRDTKAYADQLTTLAAGANTSASALADFSSQLAPLGRMVGMSQTDITGIATAFTKAGQDGFQAANVFSKMVSDIAYATQTGSPDLSKYANLIGVTMDQFKDMSGTEQVVKIFDQLNRLGPRAITELNQLGYDGMRTMRAITAMSNQSGGIGTSIQKARAAFGDGSVDRGSAASMKGLTDEFAKMRSELAMTAESIGATFAPALTKVMEIVEKMASGFRALMAGPFGDFIKGIMAVVAPVATLSGTLLTMAGTLAKVATAALALRGAGAIGFRDARQGGGFIQTGGLLGMMGRGGPGPVTTRGQAIANNGSWFQRGMYNMGALAGGLAGTRGGGPGVVARGAGLGMTGVGMGSRLLGEMLYSPLGVHGVNDPTRRARMFQASTMGGSLATAGRFIGNIPIPGGGAGGWTAAGQAGMTATQAQAATVQQASRLSRAFGDINKEAGPLRRGFQSLGAGLGSLLGSLGSAGMGAARWGAQAGGSLAMRALPMMGSLAMSPLGLMAGGIGGMMLYDKFRDKSNAEFTDLSGSGNAYRQSAGLSNNPVWTPGIDDPDPKVSMTDALRIDQNDQLAATRESHKLTNKGLYGLDEKQATAYLSTQWETYKNDATARQNVVLDLIDKFDAQTAGNIIEALDSGQKFDVSSWDLSGMEGLTKKEGGDRINGALGMVEDMASASYLTGGAEGAQSTRAQEFARVFQGVLAGTDINGVGNTEDDAFTILEDQLLGGKTNFSSDDIARLTKDVYQGEGGGLVTSKDMAGLLEGDLTKDKSAELLARVVTRSVANGTEGAEEGGLALLNNLGVENAEDIDVSDFNQVNEALLKVLNNEGMGVREDPNSLQNRLRDMGGTGGMVADSLALQNAATNVEDIEAQYEAIDSIYRKSYDNNQNILKTFTDLGNIQGEIGNTSDHTYQILDAVRAKFIQDQQWAQGLMTRPQQYESNANILGARLADSSGLNADQKAAAQDEFIQQTLEQAQYFKQMLLQQRQFELSMARAQEDFGISRERMEEQFNLSRSRAQDDFALQRKYQEQDYQLGRRRAESDYQLQVQRGTQSYNRGMRRAHADFHLSRKRQEEDYNHSVEQMIKAQAQQMYNAYERIHVQRTSSTNFLTLNIRDQVDAMNKQIADLDTARGMGLSDEVIQQLGLGKTENAQQLSRMIEDLRADPSKVGELNTLIQQSLAAAGELVTDESSNEWAEWERQYDLARDRALEDFKKSVRRSRKDFNIQMEQMEDDFRKSMNRQAKDYEKAQDRQQEAFSKSMSRAAEDYNTAVDNMTSDFGRSMARAQEDMDLLNQNVAGNLKSILIAATQELSGETQKQAQLVLDTFTGLDKTLGDEGVSIMQRMAEIFGFDYTPPKKSGNGGKGASSGSNNTATTGSHTSVGTDAVASQQSTSHASGGVLNYPRSIASDNMHFYSKDHGMLSLAGGEAIMVPEWVDQMGGPAAIKAMNDAARGKRMGFWQGGVMPLPGATSIVQHLEGYPSATWSGDLNWPGRSDYGKPIVAYQSGVARPFDYGYDNSYGRGVVVEGGGGVNSLYAHMSSIVKGIAGENVKAGQVIGYVGDYGNTGNPPTSHLHFEIKNGGWALPWVGNDGLTGKKGGQLDVNGNVLGMADVLKASYANIEEAAAQVKIGGGIPSGHMSKVFNRYARKAWKKFDQGFDPTMVDGRLKWMQDGGVFDKPTVVGVGEAGPEMVIPLDGRGANFISDIMMKTQLGAEARGNNLTGSSPMVTAGTMHNYTIDRSTTFSGPITVQANNPGEMINQLRQRQRVAALSQAALGGSRV